VEVFDGGGVEGLHGSIYVDWIEKTTEQEDLLAKKVLSSIVPEFLKFSLVLDSKQSLDVFIL